MRGDSRRFERDPFSRQNATDEGQRTLYQPLSAGTGRSTLSCRNARAQLATYRRDDWSASEMRDLSEHLAICASCRQVEAAYRRVGESLRLLPTLIPDSSFRERVFAAIAAERQRLGPAAMRASRAETEPSLPVVRAPITLPRARRRIGPMPLAAMVAAAVLLVSLVTMQWISGINSTNLTTNLSRGANAAAAQSRMSSYLPDQRFFQVSDVRATHDWLSYVASDGAGATMLFVVNRHNGASHTLLTSPEMGNVTLVSLSSHWIVWSVSNTTGWSVATASLTGSTAWRAQLLEQSETSTLTGAWASDTEALIATSISGVATLERMTIASSATSSIVIATGSHQGAIIVSPSMANGTVYWADVWADMQGSLHSAIWSATASGATPILQAGGEAYAPIALSGNLVWINSTRALNVSASGGAAAIIAAASQASGKLLALDLSKGKSLTLANQATAATLRARGATVLWIDSSVIQGYDFGARRPLTENSLLRHAQVANANDTALTWYDGSHIVVYTLS